MNPFEGMITAVERELGTAIGDAEKSIGDTVSKAESAAANSLGQVFAPLTGVFANLGPLLVGIGFFALGAGMVILSSLEDLTDGILGTQQNTQRIAGKVAKVAELIP
jgi:hypothetical protein